MCLIAFAWHSSPGRSMVVAANRDEYHARPTAPAAFWLEVPEVFGGRDLKDGGTWMGVARDGRFAALTNHRGPASTREAARSRGHLVADYLRGRSSASAYAAAVASQRHQYNGFNLLVSDRDSMWYAASEDHPSIRITPGVHVLSNARLDTPWPKATGLASSMSALLMSDPDDDALIAGLLQALNDTRIPPDTSLPETGVGLERERMLAARKIVAPMYGTRSSSVLILRVDGSIRFTEVSFDAAGLQVGEVRQSIGSNVPLLRP